MDKSEYGILVVSDGMVHGLDVEYRLTKAGFSAFFHARDFVEALGMIEKYKPHIMILDLCYFGFRCVDGKLSERKFATYVWNKYGIPHVYLSPASKPVWKEIKLHESRPLSIIGKPFRDEEIISIIYKSFIDSDGQARIVAKIRRVLREKDKNLIRLAFQRARD